MWRSLLLGLFIASAAPRVAFSQIIYQPVQYQYDGFYYGGDNPAIFARAMRDSCALYLAMLHRPLSSPPPRVYTDCLPWVDAALYGMTPNDAQNQAYQSIPRHFRKADLLDSAVWVDGALVVPARAPVAGRIEIKPYRRRYHSPPATQPAGEPRPLLIIPRDALERPIPRPQLVSARSR